MSWTFEDIANEAGLESPAWNEYVLYMRIRWKRDEGKDYFRAYAWEWAERFKEGVEYELSDIQGKTILIRVYRDEYIEEWGRKDPDDLEEWQAEAVCSHYYPDCEDCPWYEDLGYQGRMTLTPGNSIGTNISIYKGRCKYTKEDFEKWK